MDNLKQYILIAFKNYMRKLNRGYPPDKKEYYNIIEAMRMVNSIENFTFSQPVINSVISHYTFKLRT